MLLLHLVFGDVAIEAQHILDLESCRAMFRFKKRSNVKFKGLSLQICVCTYRNVYVYMYKKMIFPAIKFSSGIFQLRVWYIHIFQAAGEAPVWIPQGLAGPVPPWKWVASIHFSNLTISSIVSIHFIYVGVPANGEKKSPINDNFDRENDGQGS